MKRHFTKPTKQQVWKFIKYWLIVIAGNAIASAAAAFFIEPNNLVMGGTTGIGIFIKHLLERAGKTGLDWVVSLTVYVANIALFILGACLLGKKFAVATAAGTILYPSFLSLFTLIDSKLHSPMVMEGDILPVIFGALLFGIGLGMVIRVGASTGGTDIPPLIFHKYFGIPVSVGMWGIDLSIVVLQAAAGSGVKDILYGILITLVSSFLVDQVALIGSKRAQVQIISRKHEEIRKMLLNKLNKGVTMLYGKTGFLRDDCYVIMTVVSNRDVVKLKNEVEKIDPEAFFMVNVISEVRGRGFSSDRVVLPKSEERDVTIETPPESSEPLPQENVPERTAEETALPKSQEQSPENEPKE